MSLKRNASKTAARSGLTRPGEDFSGEVTVASAFLLEAQAADSFPPRKPLVRVFTIYEHDPNQDRAREVHANLARRLGPSLSFSFSWWKLKSLWHPKMIRMATETVARADVILFSLVSGGALPQPVKDWIESRLITNPVRRVSLLALLETGGIVAPRLSPTEVYLRHLSLRADVDCLCYSDGMPSARFSQPDRRHRRGNRTLAATTRRSSHTLTE